jgi:capsular polysaccharide biosynthesis protein
VIAPFRYAARRLIGKEGAALSDVARRTWVVHPAATERRPPALFLDGQLDRVEGVQEETTLEFERARVLGGDVVHAATLGYEIADATVVGGSVYAGRARIRLLPTAFLPAALRPALEELDRAALDCTYVGNRYFGHWLLDDCPLHLLAREYAPPVGVARPAYAHEDDYVRLWGFETRRLTSARVRSLMVFQDHGQNPSKRARHEWLRSPVLGRAPSRPWPGVYLRRGRSGVQRILTNEEEIEARLSRRGFAIVDAEAKTVGEILAICAGTRAVVGVEGSQMAHALLGLAAPGGTIVALQLPWRFNNLFKDVADCLGFRYAFVVGARDTGGFRVDPGELERTLDLAGSA